MKDIGRVEKERERVWRVEMSVLWKAVVNALRRTNSTVPVESCARVSVRVGPVPQKEQAGTDYRRMRDGKVSVRSVRKVTEMSESHSPSRVLVYRTCG